MSSLSALALIGVLSIACQWGAWRLKVPAILPLLITGLVIGPWLGYLQPNQVFGDILFPLISLSVAIILFEGSLTLRFDEIKGHGRMVTNLVTIGMLITWVLISVAAHFLIGFDWELSALFGALVVVTGPTVIMPMLRSVRPLARIGNILRWEGIIIDPIGALLAVLVYEFILAQQGQGWSEALIAFFTTIAVGFVFGLAAAVFIGHALKRDWFPHYLKNVAVLGAVLGVFAASNALQHESGLLTVTVMGMALANMRGINLDDILEFKETLSVLLISGLFIILAARIDANAFSQLGWEVVALIAFIIFVVRPISVWVSGIGSQTNFKEKLLLSWISPRGIVAAAVSALFALKLEQNGFENAGVLVPMVFLVILSTVVLQSLTAKPVAHLLQLREPPAHGYLIFGASPFVRQIAIALKKKEIPVLLADTNWEHVKEARMADLPVYFGNPASEHAANHMDLTGIGKLLIMSPYRQLNPDVAAHFRDWFDSEDVNGLPTMDDDNPARQLHSSAYREKLNLFGKGVTFAKLASLSFQGAEIKTTPLTESFSFTDYQEHYGNRAIPLFAIDERGRCRLFTTEHRFIPDVGWQVIALVTADEIEKQRQQKVKDQQERQDESSS